jgi:hypothetical protein
MVETMGQVNIEREKEFQNAKVIEKELRIKL